MSKVLSEALIIAITYGSLKVIPILLTQIPVVTEKIMITAVKNERSGMEILRLLLKQRGKEVRFS